jgi:hypothetical protein
MNFPTKKKSGDDRKLHSRKNDLKTVQKALSVLPWPPKGAGVRGT